MARGKGNGKKGGGKKGKPVYKPKDRRGKDTASTSDRLFRNVDRTQFWTNIAGVASSQGHFTEVQILANHFGIRFNDPPAIITRYKVEIHQLVRCLLVGDHKVPMEKLSPKNKSEILMRSVVEQLYSQHPMHFPRDKLAYNGLHIFSDDLLPTGAFRVDIPDKSYYYDINVVKVDQVELSKLREYFSDPETISGEDRAILFQGLDSLMKESPTRNMIRILRRNFYEKKPKRSLRSGAALHTGFKQSLKLTSQGPALCLDYSAVLFYKTNFDDFLRDTVRGYRGMEDLGRFRDQVEIVLNGLKIRATHTKIRYTFVGLTRENTGDLDFVEKPGPPTVRTTVVDYFRTKHGLVIKDIAIPCLKLRRFRESPDIFMPIELCELAEGQMYRDQQLDGVVKETSVLEPHIRKQEISKTVSDPHGPFSNGVFYKNFGIQLSPHMTVVDGGLINSPVLKLKGTDGKSIYVQVNRERCDWNYSRRNFAEGKKVEGWAFVNFAHVSEKHFIEDLKWRSSKLGMSMEEPVLVSNYSMDDISSIGKIKKVVGDVVSECKGRALQIIIFAMRFKCDYYGYLKWYLETKAGVISQCFLSKAYNYVEKKKMFLDNLCMKINGKIWGSNVELRKLPHFSDGDRVMLIGADVNHPAAGDKTSSSIAAVVGTVNWPAASRYVARIETQDNRKERIAKFGEMCKDLVHTFFELNKCKPDKIVVFRDGVGEGQLKEELGDLERTIFADDYKPKITVVVAKKRHHTRIFRRGHTAKNVLPGTVVDTVIVDPSKSNFFLCSHYGGMGTSKPVHYDVLRDENEFPLHDLQTLIYHLCFTYARCSKPVSLVTPVYYADRVANRGRMYYKAALIETSANANAATSSSSSSANPSVNLQDCCKLHRLVKDTMFFL